MKIPFYKYHGLGNDFIVVDGHHAGPEGSDFRQLARLLCDRHRGVGGDGMLVVRDFADSPEHESDGEMIVYNQDGSRPEMCGNGIRCAVRHLVEQRRSGGKADLEELSVVTDAGEKPCRLVDTSEAEWRVAVDMGVATFGDDPFEIERDDATLELYPVDMGNPHGVTFHAGDDVDLVDAVGRTLNDRRAEPFPDGVNVEFVEMTGGDRLDVVVFERGVGRTRACGTGACAAAVAAWETGRCDSTQPLEVHLPGGPLIIEQIEGHVWMTGPVAAVFSGRTAPGLV